MTEKPVEPPEVTLLGRRIILRRPTAAQLILLHRAQRATGSLYTAFQAATEEQARDELASQAVASSGGMLDVIERLIVNHDDRAWLTEQLLEGTLDLDAVIPIVQAVQNDEDEEPKPVKKAARGAARKS